MTRKACKMCLICFVPHRPMQAVCSQLCASKYVTARRKAKEDKAFRKETKARKDKIKSKGQWAKEAQASFNKYIRVRDKGKVCISCNRHISDIDTLRGHNIDAGHYRSVGGSGLHLRFNTWNCHSQCVQCNRDRSGAVVDYRINLIRRIGQDRVDQLEQDQSIRKFDIEYYKRVKTIFNKRAKLLQSRYN